MSQLQNKLKIKHLEKENKQRKQMEKLMLDNGWFKTKFFDIFPWSVSGVESCVVVRNPEISVAFDMGYTFSEAVRCPTVFIRYI